MLRVLVFCLISGLAVVASARECTADVDLVSEKLVGKRFFTTWRVEHDAGKDRLATVYFESVVSG